MEIDWSLATPVIAVVAIGLLIHCLIETVYFLRILLTYLLATFIKKKVHILEKCSLRGKVELEIAAVTCLNGLVLQVFAQPATST